jgi:acyl carrier protein
MNPDDLDRIDDAVDGITDERVEAQLRRVLDAAGYDHSATAPLERTGAERVLAGIWADVLGVERVDVDRDATFSDLGGDSFALIEMISRAQQAGFDVSFTDVFDQPTVASLAARARARDLADNNPRRPPQLLTPTTDPDTAVVILKRLLARTRQALSTRSNPNEWSMALERVLATLGVQCSQHGAPVIAELLEARSDAASVVASLWVLAARSARHHVPAVRVLQEILGAMATGGPGAVEAVRELGEAIAAELSPLEQAQLARDLRLVAKGRDFDNTAAFVAEMSRLPGA